VAVAWLDHHPDDYLTISKLLWHQDLVTTLQVYGRNFDESHAVCCRMEAWLTSRRQSKVMHRLVDSRLPGRGRRSAIRVWLLWCRAGIDGLVVREEARRVVGYCR